MSLVVTVSAALWSWSSGSHPAPPSAAGPPERDGRSPGPRLAPPPLGPYQVRQAKFQVESLDFTGPNIDVVIPVGAPDERFPYIAFAHGFGDDVGWDQHGGVEDYADFGPALASYGFVVGFARSCIIGCISDCKSLPWDPPCFGDFYKQQLLNLEWASRSSDAMALPINRSAGYGVVGHSMGGQATAFSAARNSSSDNISAAVLLHPFTHTYPALRVPFLVFTGTAEDTAPPAWSKALFDAPGAWPVRGLVNKVGATHHEPQSGTDYNPRLAYFAAAWLKLYLTRTPRGSGLDFEAAIFGNSTGSLCGGGDGKVLDCELRRR